jgi:hypothetical protein
VLSDLIFFSLCIIFFHHESGVNQGAVIVFQNRWRATKNPTTNICDESGVAVRKDRLA